MTGQPSGKPFLPPTPTEMAKVLLPSHLFTLFQEKLDEGVWNSVLYELQANILATLIWDHHTGVLP